MPAAFVAVKDMAKVPVVVGIPDSKPVEVFKLTPEGNFPVVNANFVGELLATI